MNRGFEIFEAFCFNRTDKAFEIFLSNGDSGYWGEIHDVSEFQCHFGTSFWEPASALF